MPLFPGDCELRQLLHIFKLLGTPTEEEWAGVSQLRDWHEFPNWRKQSLAEHFPTLEPAGVDLLDAMFIYDPADRITVRSHTSVPALYGSLLWPICDACTKPLIPWLESLISCRGLLCFACLRHCSAASAAAPTLAMYHMLLAFFPSPHEEQTACASSAIQTLKKMLAHDGGSCACRRRMRCTTPTLMTWTRTR